MQCFVYQNRGAPAQPAAAPAAAAPANGAGAPNGAAGTADYSAQWAEYYRSVGKHKEAEAIEAQIKQKVELPYHNIPSFPIYNSLRLYDIFNIDYIHYLVGCGKCTSTIPECAVWIFLPESRSCPRSPSTCVRICWLYRVFCLQCTTWSTRIGKMKKYEYIPKRKKNTNLLYQVSLANFFYILGKLNEYV